MVFVEHVVGDVALVAQVALAVMQGDMDGIVVAHVASEMAT